jgi:hypothetical protein
VAVEESFPPSTAENSSTIGIMPAKKDCRNDSFKSKASISIERMRRRQSAVNKNELVIDFRGSAKGEGALKSREIHRGQEFLPYWTTNRHDSRLRLE